MSDNSKIEKIKGIIPPIITSFDKEGNLNEEGQRAVVSFLNRHVHGYYACGTYGSGPLMNIEERKRTLEIVLDEATEDKFVIAHVGSPATRISVELGKHAKDVAADAIASVPPFYYRHKEEEVKNHFKILREKVDLPIFFYNNPATTGFSLTPKFLGELINEGLLDGIKDSSFDIMIFYDFMRKTESVRKSKKEDFIFIVGTEALMLPAILAGAKGSIAGAANCMPEDCVKCYEAIMKGEISKASSIQERVLGERDITHIGPTIPAVHAILKLRGLDAGYPRSPFQEVDEGTLNRVKESLEKFGIGPV